MRFGASAQSQVGPAKRLPVQCCIGPQQPPLKQLRCRRSYLAWYSRPGSPTGRPAQFRTALLCLLEVRAPSEFETGSPVLVEVKDIDRYAHPACVNGRTGPQQHSCSGHQGLPPHQANELVQKRICNLNPVAHNADFAGRIDNRDLFHWKSPGPLREEDTRGESSGSP